MTDMRLLCADGPATLRRLDAGSARLMLTDPPYGIADFMKHRGRNPNRTILGGDPVETHGWDDLDPHAWELLIDRTLTAAEHVLAPGGTLIMFTTARLAGRIVDRLDRHGLYYKTVGTWIKHHPRPLNMSLQFVPATEAWIYAIRLPAYTGVFHNDGRIIPDWVSANPPHADETVYGRHPTQKPVGLMDWFIRLLTDPDDLVVDPFMGSGSTGVAAIHAGRRFLGCDLDDHWVHTARRRCRDAAACPDLC